MISSDTARCEKCGNKLAIVQVANSNAVKIQCISQDCPNEEIINELMEADKVMKISSDLYSALTKLNPYLTLTAASKEPPKKERSKWWYHYGSNQLFYVPEIAQYQKKSIVIKSAYINTDADNLMIKYSTGDISRDNTTYFDDMEELTEEEYNLRITKKMEEATKAMLNK